MVRVISVHNFPRQNVSSVNDVTGAAVASGDVLLLGQLNHNIAIRGDGSQEEKYMPTVDQPVCVEYSHRGNYIATLETRGDVKFVRVYLSWELADGATPLRARIAGIVTPLSQIVTGVEMLEVPTPAMPTCIAVCPFSGNLVVGCNDKISVFKYGMQRHDISKFDFADFFKAKWSLQLGFAATNVRLCEDIIAAYNGQCLAVVRVIGTANSNAEVESKRPVEKISGPIDLTKLVECPDMYDIDYRTHVFPSIDAERYVENTPFLPYSGPPVKLIFDSPAKKDPVAVKHLLQVQLSECVVSSSGRSDISETFVCVNLTPFYHKSADTPSSAAILGSPSSDSLFAVSCFLGTQQEGYLYHYLRKTQKLGLVSVYPFTAPLQDAVVDDGLLHALTDAGLETYTLRVPTYKHHLHFDEQNEPICLVGLRPFVQVRHMLLGSQSLFLLASQEPTDPTTVYHLTLPDPGTLWGDFLAAAEENRWDAPSTYSHLIKEANFILRARRERLQQSTWQKSTAAEERYVLVDTLFRQSCLILADHFLLHGEREESFYLYKTSESKLTDVMRRIQNLYQDVPAEHRAKFEQESVNARLLEFVKESLREEDERYNSFGENREEFYTPDISNFVSAILDVLEKHDKANVSRGILSSAVIQQFGSDKSLHILDGLENPQPADLLALAIIHLQKGKTERGQTILGSVEHTALEPLLLSSPHLLWETENSPSELTPTLLQLNPIFLSSLLSSCVQRDVVPFVRVQKMLTLLLQDGGIQSKNAADVLESFLEDQLDIWTKNKHFSSATATDAVNSLTCLHLTRLSQRRETQSENILFLDSRPKYLDQLPPFGPDFNNVLSPQHSPSHVEEEPKNVLTKLQSLLGSDLARGSRQKVRLLMWQTPKVFGSLSLHVQCAAAEEASQMLINFAPQALLAYLKEAQFNELAWSNMIQQIQLKISSATETKRKFFYEQLLNSLMEHIAQRLSLESVAELLPSDHPERNQYLRLAYNHQQAQQVRSLIMLTGGQLL